jgi:hypothetical protein
MYLFPVNKQGTVLLHPDAMELMPEFAILDDKKKLILILVVDDYSPYHNLPEIERINNACNQVYGSIKPKLFNSATMKNAVEAYKALQYNPKKELIKTYQKKIELLSDDLMSAVTPTAIKNITGAQKDMRKVLEELEGEVTDDEEREAQIKGGGRKTYLENLIENQDRYKLVTNRRNK